MSNVKDYQKKVYSHRHDKSFLKDLESIVYSKRDKEYGHPYYDFQCSADILRALVKRRYGVDIPFEADFIGLFMACGVKGSREAGKPKRDNRLDMSGYSITMEMIHNKKEEETKKNKRKK